MKVLHGRGTQVKYSLFERSFECVRDALTKNGEIHFPANLEGGLVVVKIIIFKKGREKEREMEMEPIMLAPENAEDFKKLLKTSSGSHIEKIWYWCVPGWKVGATEYLYEEYHFQDLPHLALKKLGWAHDVATSVIPDTSDDVAA
jgi:hypothetical protein